MVVNRTKQSLRITWYTRLTRKNILDCFDQAVCTGSVLLRTTITTTTVLVSVVVVIVVIVVVVVVVVTVCG